LARNSHRSFSGVIHLAVGRHDKRGSHVEQHWPGRLKPQKINAHINRSTTGTSTIRSASSGDGANAGIARSRFLAICVGIEPRAVAWVGRRLPAAIRPDVPPSVVCCRRCPGKVYSFVGSLHGGPRERRRTTKRVGLLRGDHLRFEVDAQRLGNASAVGGVSFGAVGDMPLLDMPRRSADLTGCVVEQCLLLSWIHFAE
jgi:hypothetical protein